jgi:hypothetical protein
LGDLQRTQGGFNNKSLKSMPRRTILGGDEKQGKGENTNKGPPCSSLGYRDKIITK